MTKSSSSTTSTRGSEEIKNKVSFARSSVTSQHNTKATCTPSQPNKCDDENGEMKEIEIAMNSTILKKSQSLLSSTQLVNEALTTALDDFIVESWTKQVDNYGFVQSQSQQDSIILTEKNTEDAAPNLLVEVVKTPWENNLTGSEESAVSEKKEFVKKKIRRSTKQKQSLQHISSKNAIKPWYSSSSFDNNAAEFLANCSQKSSRLSSISTSRTSQSSTSSVVRSRIRVTGGEITGEIRRPASLKSTIVRHKKTSANKTNLVIKGRTIAPTKKEKMRDSGSDDIPIDAQIQSEDDTEGAQRGSSVPSSLGESIDHITRPARVFQFDEKFTNEKSKSSNISAKISNKPKQGAKFDLQVNNKKGVWRTVLNKSQLDAFRRLFCRFDQTKSGGISPAELFQATLELLPDTGNDLSIDEVSEVLKEFDLKGTGEIEFDEFLFAMIHPKNYLKIMSDDDRKKLAKEIKVFEEFTSSNQTGRKNTNTTKKFSTYDSLTDLKRDLFFTMLKTATKKDSMEEIRHFYVNRIKKLNDHVIHDWSAGQRCIGLSYQEMIKRYEHISKELKDEKSPFAGKKEFKDSPYAQPLRWGCNGLLKQDEPKRVRAVSANIRKTSVVRAKSARPASTNKQKSDQTKFSIPDKTSGGNVTSDLQSKVEAARTTHNVKIRDRPVDELQRTYSTPASKLEKMTTVEKRRVVSAKKRAAPLRRPRISEFVCTPKVVPLPRYPLQFYPQTFNYDDLPEIRQKAAIIHEDYYNELKKVAATNSRTIYKQLQVEQMRPTMRNHFKKSYLAYSGDFEPFVVSPWIPFPAPSPWIPYPPLGQSMPKAALC